jgi:hypothetical protein
MAIQSLIVAIIEIIIGIVLLLFAAKQGIGVKTIEQGIYLIIAIVGLVIILVVGLGMVGISLSLILPLLI